MKIMLSKALVSAIICLFVGAGVIPVFVAEAQFEDYELFKEIISKKVNSIYNQPSTICKQNNILISSDNSEDDMNPKITRKGDTLVAAYEKVEESLLEQTIQVSYSEDKGKTWNAKFNFNSQNIPNGSGVLQSPDIKYAPDADEFFLAMIDPLADNYQLIWIPGDIYSAESTTGYDGSYWVGFSDHKEVACSYVNKWFLSLCTVDVAKEHATDWAPVPLVRTLKLTYAYHNKETEEILSPPDMYPDGARAQCYYDANLILHTAPSYKPEMATGGNRVCVVTEHYNETTNKNQIVYKATITDVDVLLGTRGGAPKDMDRYADIEAWPWQRYLLEGTDPDVSANGNYVCVVCSYKNIVGDWDIICAYSKDDGENWNYSFVANELNIDEKYPAVYATETDVYCCYVKSRNLYLVVSKDKGNTWSEPVKINDVDGSVVEEPGTADLLDAGVVWIDSRNGNKDIFFNEIGPNINISFSGGFGLKIEICNHGNTPLTLINWSITIDGPLIFIGKGQSGYISELPPGGCVTIKNMMIMGIGTINIIIQIGDITKSASGFILGPFVIL